VISRIVAERKGWKIYEEKSPYNIQFGKKGSITRVTHYVMGAGLIKKAAVVDDAHTNLISTSLLIQDSKRKDITVVYSDKKVKIINGVGTVITEGNFDDNTKLYYLNLDQTMNIVADANVHNTDQENGLVFNAAIRKKKGLGTKLKTLN
jgi:hypothetical protein